MKTAFWWWAVALFWCGCVGAKEVHVAVAANFKGTLEDLSALWTQQGGAVLKISSGASGKLYAQIKNGAPFDVFLSADGELPKRLAAEDLALASTQFTYSIGTLALWGPGSGAYAQPQEALRSVNFRHLAIANPRTAPYGAAAVAVLEGWGLWENLRERIVTAESVGQAFQFVATGNAEFGLVAWAQVLEVPVDRRGRYWPIPATLHAPLHHDAILLKHGANNEDAVAFLAFLRGRDAQALIESRGYGVSGSRDAR